ncbi:MAG: hypothetical protein ASARMPRED_000861 [Alectoria sarmentosa]|nr:MAG: hypothetical protein ASARMPRED_000861 [Alectoria sarmentosa]
MSKATSFDGLPSEIAYHICTFLQQQEVSALSATSKAIYLLFRPILYRHLNVSSFTSLTLLSRTFTRATYMGKADHNWSTQECLDQTKTLDLTIDQTKDSARNNGQPPATILVARSIQSIVRRCPNLAITLRFAHCQCDHTPISGLDSEIFPRVTKLVLYVGRHDPVETLPGRPRTMCTPNAKFWRPLVNGTSFPDCLNLEIRHYWATNPPTHASLDLQKRYPDAQTSYGNYRMSRQRGILHGRRDLVDGPLRADQIVGLTGGLKRFESIMLECPPELDSPLLMQLLGNPNSVAVNLVKLELRFCNLDYETISKLLYHAPPNLQHLVLLCWDDDRDFHGYDAVECPHLCPLIRDFSKKLAHLEFAAPTVCRELFFDDLEIRSLRQNGITTNLGTGGGAITGHENLDAHAIRESVRVCRKQKRSRYRTGRIKEAITTAKAQSGGTTTSSLFGGGTSANSSAARAQREAEASLDEEEEKRTRSIEGSKTPWFRRIIAWHGLCHPNDTWEEVQLAAGMEEMGIEWVVANKDLGVASQHSGGKLPIILEISRAFEEKFDFDPRQFSGTEASCDESDLEPDPLDEL